LKLGVFKNLLQKVNPPTAATEFVVVGKVNSVGTNSFVVDATGVLHVANMTNGQVTVKVDANTKFTGTDNASSISATSVGKSVLVVGNVTGSDLLATKVNVGFTKQEMKQEKKAKTVAVGEVTAVSANSITIKNNVTGDTKTITTDTDTKVNVDGVSKTVADVQVGDKGWVKFKTVGTTLVAKFVHLFR